MAELSDEKIEFTRTYKACARIELLVYANVRASSYTVVRTGIITGTLSFH